MAFSFFLVRRFTHQNRTYCSRIPFLISQNFWFSNRHIIKPFLNSPSQIFHEETTLRKLSEPKTSLSARISFVFDQYGVTEKERSSKDEALQRICTWRVTKKKKNEDETSNISAESNLSSKTDLRSLSRQDIQIWVGHGWPSTDKKVVFSGKMLKKFVHVNIEDVCSSCKLKSTCEKAYLLPRKEDEAQTIDAIYILFTYGFYPINGSVENKALQKMKTVRKLLHEVVKLSAVPIDLNLPPPECDFAKYRRGTACFHCDHPPDEYMENQMQARQHGGPRTRLERVRDVPEGFNAWNFDFDNNKSDGSDVAAFEYADPRIVSDDSVVESHSQSGNVRGFEKDSLVTSGVQTSRGRYSDHDQTKSGTGFEDFNDVDIDSYELETPTNSLTLEPLRDFFEVGGYYDHHSHAQQKLNFFSGNKQLRIVQKGAFLRNYVVESSPLWSCVSLRNYAKKVEGHLKKHNWTKFSLWAKYGLKYSIVTVDGRRSIEPSRTTSSTGGYLLVGDKLRRWFYSLEIIIEGETILSEFQAIRKGLREAVIAQIDYLIVRSDNYGCIEILQRVGNKSSGLKALKWDEKQYTPYVEDILEVVVTMRDVKWVWLKGTKNPIADALSRKAKEPCDYSIDAKEQGLPADLSKNFKDVL